MISMHGDDPGGGVKNSEKRRELRLKHRFVSEVGLISAGLCSGLDMQEARFPLCSPGTC